jgi:hypothetical protein
MTFQSRRLIRCVNLVLKGESPELRHEINEGSRLRMVYEFFDDISLGSTGSLKSRTGAAFIDADPHRFTLEALLSIEPYLSQGSI